MLSIVGPVDEYFVLVMRGDSLLSLLQLFAHGHMNYLHFMERIAYPTEDSTAFRIVTICRILREKFAHATAAWGNLGFRFRSRRSSPRILTQVRTCNISRVVCRIFPGKTRHTLPKVSLARGPTPNARCYGPNARHPTPAPDAQGLVAGNHLKVPVRRLT